MKKKKRKKRKPFVEELCCGMGVRFMVDSTVYGVDDEHLTLIMWNGKGDGDLVKIPLASLPKRLQQQAGYKPGGIL